MEVMINNVKHVFPEGCTLEQVIGQRRLNSIIQIRVNGEIISVDSCKDVRLKEGDRVKTKRIAHMT